VDHHFARKEEKTDAASRSCSWLQTNFGSNEKSHKSQKMTQHSKSENF